MAQRTTRLARTGRGTDPRAAAGGDREHEYGGPAPLPIVMNRDE